MTSAELRAEFDHARVPKDRKAQEAICAAFTALRSFLEKNVTNAGGVSGFVFRKLFPRTSEGLRAVADLLDEYVKEQCG